MVLLKDVKMKYPGSRAETLRDIDLTIQDGEFVFLVGPSGSGKTTIIKLLTGEIRATGGQIEVNGFDLRTMKRRNLPKLRRSLGVIFQDYREIKKRVPYVLDLVALSGREDRYPRELSGGEQQRVAIARALVNSPDMIIADEPTGNLDPARSLEIMLLFQKINELGTTVLIVTHEKELVNAFSERVVSLSDGCLISDGMDGYYGYES